MAESIAHRSWKSVPQDGPTGHCLAAQVFDQNGLSIAVMETTDDPSVATKRAFMMAAAPDLYAALEGGRQKLQTYADVFKNDKELTRLLAEWDILLAKARGEIG